MTLEKVRCKLKTVADVFDQHGIGGLSAVTAEKVGMWYMRTGNAVRLDRCVFELENLDEDISSLLLRGEYERPERKSVRRFLDRRLPVIELGSCMGVVSCITNRLMRYPEQHIVVEANPTIIDTLRNNAARNGCRFSIVNAAIASDESPFVLSSHLMEVGRAQ